MRFSKKFSKKLLAKILKPNSKRHIHTYTNHDRSWFLTTFDVGKNENIVSMVVKMYSLTPQKINFVDKFFLMRVKMYSLIKKVFFEQLLQLVN